MLDYLRIRGLALLDDVAVDLAPGMNVLTGETGAGKSIIVDALGLLRGARSRSELVREGAESTRVEAQFALGEGSHDRLRAVLEAHDVELEDDALVVDRRITRGGRGRITVQGSLSTRKVLAEIGEHLVEICSQHEHHSLTHVQNHLSLLDAHAGLDALLSRYQDAQRSWQRTSQELSEIRALASERIQRADYLRFQIEELEEAQLERGEYEALAERTTLMNDAHRLQAFAARTQQRLYEDDDAIAAELARLAEQGRRGSESLPVLAEIVELLDGARIGCEEAAAAAARLGAEVDLEPAELERAQERLQDLESLRRKHGCESADALLDRLGSMTDELQKIETSDDRLRALEGECETLLGRCRQLGLELHKKRQAASPALCRGIEKELAALHMKDARVRVDFADVDMGPTGVPGPRGFDRVELMFGANTGEALAPLSKVASGGELSRVLLAIKGVLASGHGVSTYVFDEVDAGVGGAVAEAIGRRLHRAARARQVLCITHLPQIAAFADRHYRVEKRKKAGRTVTRVIRLDDAQRVEELARMLAGSKVSASALEHAAALIEQARG